MHVPTIACRWRTDAVGIGIAVGTARAVQLTAQLLLQHVARHVLTLAISRDITVAGTARYNTLHEESSH